MANPTESCCPYRHHVVPTQLFTVRKDFPYACPLSNPASTSLSQMAGKSSLRAPTAVNKSVNAGSNDSILLTQVNTLTSGDFGIKIKFLCDFRYDAETLRGDLTSSDTRDDAV